MLYGYLKTERIINYYIDYNSYVMPIYIVSATPQKEGLSHVYFNFKVDELGIPYHLTVAWRLLQAILCKERGTHCHYETMFGEYKLEISEERSCPGCDCDAPGQRHHMVHPHGCLHRRDTCDEECNLIVIDDITDILRFNVVCTIEDYTLKCEYISGYHTCFY